MSNNISEDLIKNIIVDLIQKINVEINANVLIFLTHLSKDEFILNTVVEVSNKLLADFPELRMEDDIIELNQLMTELPTLVFENTNVSDNRSNYNRVRDSNDNEEKHFIETAENGKSEISEETDTESSLTEKNEILVEMDKAQKYQKL